MERLSLLLACLGCLVCCLGLQILGLGISHRNHEFSLGLKLSFGNHFNSHPCLAFNLLQLFLNVLFLQKLLALELCDFYHCVPEMNHPDYFHLLLAVGRCRMALLNNLWLILGLIAGLSFDICERSKLTLCVYLVMVRSGLCVWLHQSASLFGLWKLLTLCWSIPQGCCCLKAFPDAFWL